MALTDNFDSYSDGDLNGQDGWSEPIAGAAVVSASYKLEATGKGVRQSSQDGGGTSKKSFTGQADGVQVVKVRAQQTNQRCMIILYEGTGAKNYFGFFEDGYFKYYVGSPTNAYVSYGAYSQDTTYILTIEWRNSDKKMRVKVDAGAFTDWYSPIGNFTTEINAVGPGHLGNAGSFYIDSFSDPNAVTTTTTTSTTSTTSSTSSTTSSTTSSSTSTTSTSTSTSTSTTSSSTSSSSSTTTTGQPPFDYSRGDYNILPSDDTDLENSYTWEEYQNVLIEDENRTEQSATNEFAIHLYKDKNSNNTDVIGITWIGQSSLAPSQSAVYLQIYDRIAEEWSTLASNNSANADTDFTLIGNRSTDLSNYYDINNQIACRVYQDAV